MSIEVEIHLDYSHAQKELTNYSLILHDPVSHIFLDNRFIHVDLLVYWLVTHNVDKYLSEQECEYAAEVINIPRKSIGNGLKDVEENHSLQRL